MKFFNIFKRNKNKSNYVDSQTGKTTKSARDYVDPQTGKTTKSAIVYNNANERYLKLNPDTCALVIHPGGKIEVIFTKLYDEQNQLITPEEETLMSIAVFLKQPGFAEMITYEFHKIATENLSKLTEETNE